MKARYGLVCVSYHYLHIKQWDMQSFTKRGILTIGNILSKGIGGKNVMEYHSKKKNLKCYGCRQQGLP